jgi:predicted transcriptional regulator
VRRKHKPWIAAEPAAAELVSPAVARLDGRGESRQTTDGQQTEGDGRSELTRAPALDVFDSPIAAAEYCCAAAMTHFLTRGFRRPRAALEAALGSLERRVLDVLWSAEREASVRELQQAFEAELAYTTLMTTLDRLFKKGLLERRRDGRAFLYKPRVTRDQLRDGVAADVIDSLLGAGGETARPVISTFLDAVEERDAALLDELERLIRQKRRARARRGR